MKEPTKYDSMTMYQELLARAVGRTIERIDHGVEPRVRGVHACEEATIYFTDGSQLEVSVGSNALGFVAANRIEQMHVDLTFRLTEADGTERNVMFL